MWAEATAPQTTGQLQTRSHTGHTDQGLRSGITRTGVRKLSELSLEVLNVVPLSAHFRHQVVNDLQQGLDVVASDCHWPQGACRPPVGW